jgi:hypothetical protein
MLQYLMGERIGYQIIGISIQVDPAHHMLPLLVSFPPSSSDPA